MTLKLAIICKKGRWSSVIQRLGTRWFEGLDCPEEPYHCAWYDPATGEIYDMNLRFRKLEPGHYKDRVAFYFDPPRPMPVEFVASEVGKHFYGALDVIFFPVLKILKWMNLPGDHCAEILNDQMRDLHGDVTPWRFYEAPPSPCAMLKWAAANLQPWHKEN